MSETGSVAIETKAVSAMPETKLVKVNVTPLYREKLRHFRDKYTDEIPNDEIHSHEDPNNYKYKVLKGWWTSVLPYLQLLSDNHLIVDEKLARGTKRFIENYTSQEFHKKVRLVTAGDIKKANAIIGVILKSDLQGHMMRLPTDSPRFKKLEEIKQREQLKK